MRLKTIALSLSLAVLATACMKEGDFDELRHPIEIQGDFDPVLGIPIAKMSADVGTFINMFDSTGNMSVNVDANGNVAIHMADTMHAQLNWAVSKSRQTEAKALDDTIRRHIIITGSQTTHLFNTLQNLDIEGVSLETLRADVDADIQAHLSDAFNDLISRGCRVTFDSITLTTVCSDGYVKPIHTLISSSVFDLRDLNNGRNIQIMKDEEMKDLTIHKPLYIDYRIRMNVSIPMDQWHTSDSSMNLDDIGVDSVVADIHTYLDFPLSFSSTNFGMSDTMDLDLHNLDSTMAKIREYLTLNEEEKSYMAFVIDNGLPVEIGFNAALLDEYGGPIVERLLEGDTVLAGAPVVPFEGASIAQGTTRSTIKVVVTEKLLEQLSNTRKLSFAVNLKTSQNGSAVFIRPENRVNVRAYIVASPHVSLNVSIDNPF